MKLLERCSTPQNVESAEKKQKFFIQYISCELSTQSACHLDQIEDSCVDYVFTDPPFGANINYSEMNYLWESWLKEFTDISEEAIVNRVQGKKEDDYGQLMRDALLEIHRVLKPNGWMTLMFHNSSDRIWKTLQKALTEAGFSVDGIVLFDKVHGTFKQFVSDNAVGFDLLLNCQKRDHFPAAEESPCLPDLIDEEQEAIAFAMQQLVTKSKEYYTIHYEHVNREEVFLLYCGAKYGMIATGRGAEVISRSSNGSWADGDLHSSYRGGENTMKYMVSYCSERGKGKQASISSNCVGMGIEK